MASMAGPVAVTGLRSCVVYLRLPAAVLDELRLRDLLLNCKECGEAEKFSLLLLSIILNFKQ